MSVAIPITLNLPVSCDNATWWKWFALTCLLILVLATIISGLAAKFDFVAPNFGFRSQWMHVITISRGKDVGDEMDPEYGPSLGTLEGSTPSIMSQNERHEQALGALIEEETRLTAATEAVEKEFISAICNDSNGRGKAKPV